MLLVSNDNRVAYERTRWYAIDRGELDRQLRELRRAGAPTIGSD